MTLGGETLAPEAPIDAETAEQEAAKLAQALEVLRSLGLANERMLIGSAHIDTETE